MEFSLGKQFLVIILLIFGNGIFSLLEMAIVSCHQSRLEALAGLTAEQVDWLVPHQANARIIAATAQRMHLPMEKVILTVADHGNTSAASIPLALSVADDAGRFKEGDVVVTEAIGGGLSWGAVVLRW